MFRNPRENASRSPNDHILPSTGRPPTPPLTVANGTTPTKSAFFSTPSMTSHKELSSPIASLPVLGRNHPKSTSIKRNGFKPNQSILNFFGKAEKKDESPSKDTALFFEDGALAALSPISNRTITKQPNPVSSIIHDDDNVSRFNEETTPVKKRKLNVDDLDEFMISTPPSSRPADIALNASIQECKSNGERSVKSRGGFVDDSSDDELDAMDESRAENNNVSSNLIKEAAQASESINDNMVEVVETTKVPLKPPDEPNPQFDPSVPALHRESTSAFNPGDFGEEDFDDEFFPEGEEFLERRFMEEQLAMERAFEDDSKSESGTDGVKTPRDEIENDKSTEHEASVANCPICDGPMQGLSESEASEHVNACLDGSAKPLPKQPMRIPPLKLESSNTNTLSGPKRFQKSAIARPAQANPFNLEKNGNTTSAFSKLMSGHAEDAAWAEAATNEVQSRGKPAYQRTCPFYKIMPGFFICVDAFRYGKVEGQNAYFLSHFHSDHYIGLTSQWCHGPIYASKVTCNLMRQQLRVDSKWIVPLEFEKKIEIPNTNGVFVTMIPANHCPGSSLYLFEKITGKNKDGSPKMTRVLHCGDFRACPAHVNHPLLKPDVLDTVTGLNKEQIIDTCYLDTTYLTPKYSFPSQYDVIDACAQMCVSLSKEIVDSSDGWEKVKLERAGSTMKKFLEQGAVEDLTQAIKKENEEESDDVKPKVRGRLLVVIGTYSIGKERICLGIARALDCKIYAPPSKMRICRALEDDELNSRLTSDPLEAQIHMQMLMEIRAETLHDYLVGFKPHFSRVVGFRPTGWSYRPPTSRFTENPAIQTVLHSEGWKSRFTMRDLTPQRGSTRESNCFGVPYSEHSSFRELTMFVCALRIRRVIPTVNVGSARSREKMKGWIEKWDTDKRKNGLYQVENGPDGWGSGDGSLRYGV